MENIFPLERWAHVPLKLILFLALSSFFFLKFSVGWSLFLLKWGNNFLCICGFRVIFFSSYIALPAPEWTLVRISELSLCMRPFRSMCLNDDICIYWEVNFIISCTSTRSHNKPCTLFSLRTSTYLHSDAILAKAVNLKILFFCKVFIFIFIYLVDILESASYRGNSFLHLNLWRCCWEKGSTLGGAVYFGLVQLDLFWFF